MLPVQSTLVAPMAGWQAHSNGHGQAAGFLCQLPRNRHAALVWYWTPNGNTVTDFHLLPEGLTSQECAPLAERMFRESVNKVELAPLEEPMTSERLANFSFLVNNKEFPSFWSHWTDDPRWRDDLRLLSTVSLPRTAQIAAGLLAEQFPVTFDGHFAAQLATAMQDGRIPVQGPNKVRVLAELIGLLCDTLEDGPSELAKLLRDSAAAAYRRAPAASLAKHLTQEDPKTKIRPIGELLVPVLLNLPESYLNSRQAALDSLLRADPDQETLKKSCSLEDPFVGPLPVRFSLTQMLSELLLPETLHGFMNWAEPVYSTYSNLASHSRGPIRPPVLA